MSLTDSCCVKDSLEFSLYPKKVFNNDLILFLVNHFRLLNHAAPSSFMAGTLTNHECNRVLTGKGKNLTMHNFLLFHLTKHVTA